MHKQNVFFSYRKNIFYLHKHLFDAVKKILPARKISSGKKKIVLLPSRKFFSLGDEADQRMNSQGENYIFPLQIF